MLNFDPNRFLRIQAGAVALAPKIRAEVLEALRDGAQNLFFSGTGGAAILMQPATQLLLRHSSFPVFQDYAAELILSGSKHLGKHSLVVIPSLSGTTKESIAFMEYAKSKGAKVMTLVGHADSPLGEGGQPALVNFAEDDTSSESFYIQSMLVSLSVMAARGEFDDFDKTVRELEALPEALLAVKRAIEPQAETLARHLANHPHHIITGAGNAWPQAFYYGMCILEEMQWIKTRPVHASDFFHGTLELVDKSQSVLLLKGEDECRPLAERVENFAKQHTEKLLVLDTQPHEMKGISPALRRLVSPAVLATMLERVSAHLEVITNHPLTTRRYYRRVAY